MNHRRNFLIGTAALGLGTTLASAARAMPRAVPAAPRIVDTHTHFYDPTRPEGVPWPAKDSFLYRPTYPKDWKALASHHGVTQTVVVEASKWLEDNQWILDLASREPSIIGFVGNLAPSEMDFGKHLQRFSKFPIFRGIRIAGDWPKYINDVHFQQGIRLLVENDLQLDVNGGPEMLESVVQLSARIPELRIVVDHVGGAGDPTMLTEKWRSAMERVGQQKNVYCKVSALLEQTKAAREKQGSAPKQLQYYLPILDHCWNVFGEDKLIYGSNWPVCEIGGSYSDQFRIVAEYFSAKGKTAEDKYFWRNAMSAYKWKE